MFEAQKPFIKCKEGCAYCCREGEYPISELEYINLMFYYNELEDNIKDRVNENISNLLEKSREKMYECPFLVDNRCSVYPARAIICRTFGLISYDEKGRKRMPFCVDLDLNYSNVYDKETQKELDNEIMKGLDIDLIPIDLDRCIKIALANNYDIKISETKQSLITPLTIFS